MPRCAVSPPLLKGLEAACQRALVMDSPLMRCFLGVILEKRAIKLVAEAVDEEVLERDFGRARRKPCFHITGADGGGVGRTQVAEGSWR